MENKIFFEQFSFLFLLFILLTIVDVVFRGMALWKSAKLGAKNWFICLFIFNTVGILPTLYLFYFSKRQKKIAPILIGAIFRFIS